MDGVEELNGVTVLAATNRPHIIVRFCRRSHILPHAEDAAQDPALLRPGRLDRILYVGPPDLEARMAIFRINIGRMAVEDSVDASELAAMVRYFVVV